MKVGKKTLAQHMRAWGPVGISIFAAAAVLFAIFLIYIRAPQVVNIPSPTGDEKIIAASGIEGFKVDETVCKDFGVKVEVAPDVGFVYTLTRNLNGVSELVTISANDKGEVINKDFNRHFFNTTNGQAPEQAYVTDAGWKCVKEKAK